MDRRQPWAAEHLPALSRLGVEFAYFVVLNNWSPCVWGVRTVRDTANSPQLQAIREFLQAAPSVTCASAAARWFGAP